MATTSTDETSIPATIAGCLKEWSCKQQAFGVVVHESQLFHLYSPPPLKAMGALGLS
jgi:hypothetical protein